MTFAIRLATPADSRAITKFVHSIDVLSFTRRSRDSRKTLLAWFNEAAKLNQLYLAVKSDKIIGICDLARSMSFDGSMRDVFEVSLLCKEPCAMQLLSRVRKDHGSTNKLIGRVATGITNVGLHKLMVRYLDVIVGLQPPQTEGTHGVVQVIWKKGDSTERLQTSQSLLLLYSDAATQLIEVCNPGMSKLDRFASGSALALGLAAIDAGKLTYPQMLSGLDKSVQYCKARMQACMTNGKGYY
jgi:hypothetical protein